MAVTRTAADAQRMLQNSYPLVTDDEYLSSGSSIDHSTSETLRVKLPAKYLVDGMKLKQVDVNGAFFDKARQLVSYDPRAFDRSRPPQVLMRKDVLLSFLQKRKLAIVWTVLGEKNMIGGGVMGQPQGWLAISSAYTLGKRGNVIGKIKAEFRQAAG
jgi:hypothetical protein